MDKQIVAEKLESLRRCIVRIESKCPASIAQLQADLDLQDIITLNLTRTVQLCVDIGAHLLSETEQTPPRTMGETFEKLYAEGAISAELMQKMKNAVGFRNIAVHGYNQIDYAIVFYILERNLDDFRQYARAVDSATGS